MYNKNFLVYFYNVEKVKEFIKGKIFEVELLVGNSFKEVKMVEFIKIRLEEIGILVKVVSIDSKVRDSKVRDKDY